MPQRYANFPIQQHFLCNLFAVSFFLLTFAFGFRGEIPEQANDISYAHASGVDAFLFRNWQGFHFQTRPLG